MLLEILVTMHPKCLAPTVGKDWTTGMREWKHLHPHITINQLWIGFFGTARLKIRVMTFFSNFILDKYKFLLGEAFDINKSSLTATAEVIQKSSDPLHTTSVSGSLGRE